MKAGALGPYEAALTCADPLSFVSSDGREVHLHVGRYLAEANRADHSVLDRCVDPVLDVGCGPGRIVHALAAQGRPALGVDIAQAAVALAHRRGATALIRNVFDQLPGEGRWPTIVVLDGNIGIGGDVSALLRRLRGVMAGHGSVIVEVTSASVSVDDVLHVRFVRGGSPEGPTFPWAIVSRDTLTTHASRAGLTVADHWVADDRTFVRLVRHTATA